MNSRPSCGRLSFSAMRSYSALWMFWVLLLALASGCGSDGRVKVYPTAGTLTMDGEAIGPTNFLLLPAVDDHKNPKASASGVVDEKGVITFSTFAKGDGVPAGDYQIQFMPSLTGRPKKNIPEAYGNPKSNKLLVKILEATAENPNVVKIDLDSKLKRAGAGMAAGAGGAHINSKYPPIDPSMMPKTGP